MNTNLGFWAGRMQALPDFFGGVLRLGGLTRAANTYLRQMAWGSLGLLLLGASAGAQPPQIAPLNPEFTRYARELKTGVKRKSMDGDGHALGWVPAPVDFSHLKTAEKGPVLGSRPKSFAASYDLRTLNRLTPVKDQGSYGTCWAHATCASLESGLMPGETNNFSENNLANLHGFDWGYNYGGNAFLSMAYLARWDGPVRESDDPYPNPGGSVPGLPVRKHVQQVRLILPKASATANDEIKQALMDHGALYVNYYHASAFYNSTYKSYYFSGTSNGNHAVAIVGWNDNFDKNNFNSVPAGNGAYIVRNSWGTGWGDAGYFYVSYYDSKFARGEIYAFYNAESTAGYSRVYGYDPLGWVSSMGTGSAASYWGANVFTASASEDLGAVGFYAVSTNAGYEIYVYTGVSAGAPRSGTLAATASGTCLHPGYCTIPLSSPAALVAGQRFSIVLKLTTPGYYYPVPIEYRYPGYSSAAAAAAGQSYYSDAGSSWTDLTTWESTANFCIKGYVLVPTPLSAVLSRSAANVRENGEGRFFVKLNQAPPGNVTVSVSRASGDTDLSVKSGSKLVFTSTNWGTWRTVTLAAADDSDADNGMATFQVVLPDYPTQTVAVTELDGDIGTNLALASGGATIGGVKASRPSCLIDGVHTSSANYGYTVWTNLAAPGTMTLDLNAAATVSRVRLLNYDWSCRAHRYRIESSLNGTDWTLLVNAGGEDRQGWDDWPMSGERMRYLRFTGLSNSANSTVCIAEWEVYGSLPSAPVQLSRSTANVRENGEGRFFVRLDQTPVGNVTVAVARVSGDTDLSVKSGSKLVFTPANWGTWKTVTLAAADDSDADDGTATFQIAVLGYAPQALAATELDDDIGTNLALASGGATIGGFKASRPFCLVDGVHTSSANYGYTVWTNLAAPGTMTLDLSATATVSRIRLLNYDWSYRAHRYRIDRSANGTDWTELVNAGGEDRQGWDDWPLANESARYLRFTGLSNSANSTVCVAEWEVYGSLPPPPMQLNRSAANVRENGEGRFFVRLNQTPPGNVTAEVARISGDADLTVKSGSKLVFTPTNWGTWRTVTLAAADDSDADNGTATFQVVLPDFPTQTLSATELDDDIGTNLALASGGATIGGFKASRPSCLIDGVHTSSANYGYTVWTNLAAPGTMTLDLSGTATVSRVRLLNYDWTCRVHRYRIESSLNGTDWTLLVNAGTDRQGWDDWPLAGASARYLRFTGLSNSANSTVCIAEWEVYGTPLARRRSIAPVQNFVESGPRDVSDETAEESEPVLVLTSDGLEDETGWAAVDGDPETAWTGRKPGGGYIVVEYAPALLLKTLEVEMAEGSLTKLQCLYSPDAKDWLPLPDDMDRNPVSLNFLWLLFPDDGTAAAPQVIEIRPNP